MARRLISTIGKLSSIALFEFSMVRVTTFYKIPPYLPFTKGGVIPLFGKEGRGEILRCKSIQFSDPYYHVYELLSPFNRVIIPFRDPINRSLILFVPSLAPFTPSPTPSPARDCVVIGEMVKNVMLNLFQHLMESISYETLKRVQGDKK